jgi:hypothetical protein
MAILRHGRSVILVTARVRKIMIPPASRAAAHSRQIATLALGTGMGISIVEGERALRSMFDVQCLQH